MGPAVSFVTNKTVKDMNPDWLGPLTKSSINSLNWYIQAGFGLDFWLLTLDLRYQGGLNEMIRTVQQGSQNWNFSSKNNIFQLSLGFKIL